MILPNLGHTLKVLQFPKRWIATLLVLQLGAVIFEGIGIGMLLPILEYVSQSSGNMTSAESAPSQMNKLVQVSLQYLNIENNLFSMLAICFGAILCRQFFFYVRDLFSGYVDFELSRRIRNEAFESFIKANLRYHDQVRGGDFVNELTTEMRGALASISSAIQFIGFTMLFIVYSTIAVSLSASLTSIAIIVFTVSAVVLLYFLRNMREMGRLVTQANQDMLSFLVERLNNVRLIRLSGMENAETTMLFDRTLRQRQHEMRRRKIFAMLAVVVEPIVLLVAFFLLYVSTETMQMQFETILLFFFILIRLVPILKEMMYCRQGYIGNLASADIVSERMINLKQARDPRGGNSKLLKLNNGIKFENVQFSYPKQPDMEHSNKALLGISLLIPAKKMTALVGPSGSGKSTLVDMIPCLRTPDTGEILYDEISQSALDVASIRSSVSYAPQQPQIFNVTIKDHILYGKSDASDIEIQSACKLANAHDFILTLPNGYDTFLGEGGNKLSGGQRQRIDLARALVRQAPILILDEPTANLDAESEALFKKSLTEIRDKTDITMIIIGHRLSSIQSADQIAVLKEGVIESIGTHDELLVTDGWYAKAYASQHS
jgi:ABC-type multidrug transport system fused ATPase/permease subunit